SWQDTIQSFDVDWLANRSVGIFPVNGRSAQSIVNGLERVVETDESFEPLVVFEVIPENNSILAVAKTPRALENVSVWINRLTREGANDAQVYSYDMKYARASDIAPTLSQILGISVETSNEDADVIQASADFFAPQGTLNATRVVGSEATNTLLIHSTPDEYQRILGILHRLDVPQRQVLVEATIVEVSLNDDLRYGVQYFLEDGGGRAVLSRGESFDLAPNLPGFGLTLGGTPANAVIDALDSMTSINVISSPNLMILNNESARLVVGDQVPTSVRTAQNADSATDEVFISTVEYRDTGVIFEVTPRINSSGSVILNIQQEVSLVGSTDEATGNPIISQRVIDSSVSVDSGETIVLGGLFSDRRTNGNGGIPILKDLPVAGALFGSSSRSSSQTELLVLITPRIVNDRMDARRVTQQLRSRVESLRQEDASLSTQMNIPTMNTANSAIIARSATAEQNVAEAARSVVATPAVATPAVAQVAPTPVAAAVPAGRHIAVLGSFSSSDNAQQHWRDLVGQNSAALGQFTPSFRQAGGLTMVTVGPMSRDAASKICVDVKTDCFTATQ
ncbi:MAG: SPOR domain-containing protein, partial [Paracoccaceae bacterium]|nr:SPOR domain-containing protein [Paracoccaceae bacterium]